MKNKPCFLWLVLSVAGLSFGAGNASAKTLITQYQDQSSSASIQPARMKGQPGIAVVFEGTGDLHYYATAEAAPAPHLLLTVSAEAEGVSFGSTVYPEYQYFNDPVKGKIEVWVGDFKVFIPITGPVLNGAKPKDVTVTIKGIACTSKLCLAPFTKELTSQMNLMFDNVQELDLKAAPPRVDSTEPEKTTPPPSTGLTQADSGLGKLLAGYEQSSTDEERISSTAWFFLLAVLAGLSINIMPCVLPVIPLIIMRLINQAKESPSKRVALGFAFCGGIILFFAAFAAISTAIQFGAGVKIDLNSLYRIPAAVITLFLFIVLFALVLLDVLVITLPGSVSGHQSGGGFAGSVGMGFFAGILSIPCSGAIIGAVLVWAQTQMWYVSSTALVLMGVGMALPYAVLISVPKLLDYVPKPGTWMEIFKKTGGFLLLIIAFKFMLAGLTKDHLLNVLLYGVIFGFCAWMWGTWVTFSTPKGKKWTVRLIALVLAIATGFWLLPAPAASEVNWQDYEPAVVQDALEKNQPVLIKFTIKADTTQNTYRATIDYNAIFKGAGSVPNTILLNPNKKTITNLRGIFTPDELKQIVNEQF
ncbi:MAG: protein-disulfide reductase DsbD family protein [Planctomycetota bacterium]|jgi:thiol:disulfide interchange protein DsbD